MKLQKILVLWLFIFLFASLVLAVSAIEKTGTVTGTCGENLTWTFDEASATLTISGSGAMDDYQYIDLGYYTAEAANGKYPWYNKEETWKKMKRVVVETGVTTIGENAFINCDRLEEVDLPAGVERVCKGAFAYTDRLSNISFGAGPRIFEEGVFDKSALKTLVIPEGTEILEGHLFVYNDAITEVAFPNSLVDMGNTVFMDCSALKKVTLPNDLAKLPSVLMLRCNAIERIVFPTGTRYVGGISNCASLMEVVLPDGVLECGGFRDCPLLTKIEFPESVTKITLNAEVTELTIPRQVETLRINTSALEQVVLSPDNPNFRFEDGCLIENETETLIWGRYASGIPSSVKTIADGAFYGSLTLTEAIVPSGVTRISSTVFQNCQALSYIYIPESVIIIGGAFTKTCPSLNRIEISEANARYRSVGRSVITKSAFAINTTLYAANTLISHPSEDKIPDGVEILRGIYGQDTVFEIPEGVVGIEAAALVMPTLSTLIVPRSVTMIHRAFYTGCRELSKIYYVGNESKWEAIDFVEIDHNATDTFWKETLEEIYYMNGVSYEDFLMGESETEAVTTSEPTVSETAPTPQESGCGGVIAAPIAVLLVIPALALRKRKGKGY